MALLERSLVAVVVSSYRNKRLVKTPKLYFTDTGLACFLCGISNSTELKKSPLLGAFFEAHVYGQILRAHTNRGIRPQISFFRTHDGAEIDFIVERGSKIFAIECKWNESTNFTSKPFDVFKQSLKSKKIVVIYATKTEEEVQLATHLLKNSVHWDFLFEDAEYQGGLLQ